jgi:hypothetical protein
MVLCELKLSTDKYDGEWERTVRLPFDRVPVMGEFIDMEFLPDNVPASDGGPSPKGRYEVLRVVWMPGYDACTAALDCGHRR